MGGSLNGRASVVRHRHLRRYFGGRLSFKPRVSGRVILKATSGALKLSQRVRLYRWLPQWPRSPASSLSPLRCFLFYSCQGVVLGSHSAALLNHASLLSLSSFHFILLFFFSSFSCLSLHLSILVSFPFFVYIFHLSFPLPCSHFIYCPLLARVSFILITHPFSSFCLPLFSFPHISYCILFFPLVFPSYSPLTSRSLFLPCTLST